MNVYMFVRKKNCLSYGRKFKRSNKTDFIQEKRMR